MGSEGPYKVSLGGTAQVLLGPGLEAWFDGDPSAEMWAQRLNAAYSAGLAAAGGREVVEALRPLAAIADAYDDNWLDDCRPEWKAKGLGFDVHLDQEEVYSGRGGRRLLTLGDCFRARAALARLAPAKEGA